MKLSTYDRRDFIQNLALAGIGTFFGTNSLLGQAAPQELSPLNRFSHMQQDWLMLQMELHKPLVNEWKNQAEAEAYVQKTRQKLKDCFGPLPEKTPLNAKITKTLDRDTYTVENIVFESRPGYLVTGNLYLPKGHDKPLPGVIGLCGHSATGKTVESYQSFAQGLARLGYVNFIIDPVGQGERTQWNAGWGKSRLKGSTSEHVQLGAQMSLLGEFLGTWFAWDGIRALDYLLTRKEVDPKHIGVTGNSGGGTQVSWLTALEDRWTMAAPACFVTTFQRNAENELPADSEQCPPNILKYRLDHSDCIAAMAPKPVVLLAQEKDFFDVRGTIQAYNRLKNLYTALGKPDNIKLHIGPDPHGFSQPNREALYRFFNKITGISEATKEPELTIEKDEDLWATPRGEVADLGSKPLARLTAEAADKAAKTRKKLEGEELIKVANDLLKIEPVAKAPKYRILRSRGRRQYPKKAYTYYALRTEKEIEVSVLRLTEESGFISRPTREKKRAILYVSHRSADAELRNEAWVKSLIEAEPESTFYACDLRGIGDSQPDTCGAKQFDNIYGSHYFYAVHGVMLGRPLLGQRVQDLMKTLEWLKAIGHEEIHLAGRGWGALAVVFAALNSENVKKVSLKHALSAYKDIAEEPDYSWPYAAFLPGVLHYFDLPDIYEQLKSKDLTSIEPWGAKDGMGV